MDGTVPFARRVLVTLGLGAVVLLALLLVWHARDVLLLAFAGVLLALFLRTPASWLSERTPLPDLVSLGVVVIGLIALIAAAFVFRGPAIADEARALREQLPKASEQLQQRLERYEWGQRALEQVPDNVEDAFPDAGSAISKVTGAASRTFAILANFAIILFLGLVLAGGPRPYINGLVTLVPRSRQPRAREVLAEVGLTLRWWLLGRIIAMTVIGVSTWIGLWLLDIPLAFVLALLAALLSFIPNLGPILSAIPAILLGLSESPQTALYVALLYAGIQAVESWIIDPIIDKKTVYLPPALVVVTQLSLALASGLLGVALATPLIAAGVVLVKMLYIEDVLGQPVTVRGDDSE